MSGGGGDSEEGFDLNLAPIIDCFTVLITYMLVSASFISLSMLEVKVSPVDPNPIVDPPPVVDLSVHSVMLVVGLDKSIKVVVMGQINKITPVPAVKEKFDMQRIASFLKQAKVAFPKVAKIYLEADDKVLYEDIALVLEHIKEFYTTVEMAKGMRRAV